MFLIRNLPQLKEVFAIAKIWTGQPAGLRSLLTAVSFPEYLEGLDFSAMFSEAKKIKVVECI